MARLVPFGYAFRPFFLVCGWFGLLAMAAWMWVYSTGMSPLGRLPPYLWHAHEMLFGFVGAAIAGFMLTAVPSWTGERGFAGKPLVVLTGIWFAGRCAMAAAGHIPLPALALIELAFLPAVAVTIAPSLLRVRNRNLPLLFVLGGLWVADGVFLYSLRDGNVALAGRALQIALDIVLLLITIIGGRIVPAFTSNALRKRGIAANIRVRRGIERFATGSMLVLVAADLLVSQQWIIALVALAAGFAHAARLVGWQSLRTLADPIVWVLHTAYAWLPVGLCLKAIWFLTGADWAAFWLHALSIGAAATLILGVMTRAALGHTGRPMVAGKAIAWSYALLILAAAVRVFGPALLPLAYEQVIYVASLLWIAAFLLYVAVYTPILMRPRVDGKPG